MKRISFILLSAALAAACGNDPGNGGDDDGTGPGDDQPTDEWDKELAKRAVDYNAALRIASLRLTGDVPSMTEIRKIADAGTLEAQKAEYETLVKAYLERPTFARQMLYFWRDTFKLGETAEMDFAPTFAAMLSAQNGSYTQLLTATTGTCPTLNEGTGVFANGDCVGPGPKVGVLSDKGVMKQYYSNFAFRRVKWVEETFDCAKFPIDLTGAPLADGGVTPYVGDFPVDSIANPTNGGRVNFTEKVAVRCEHCHKNLNRIAPLFANYDVNGVYQNAIAVKTPLTGEPLALASDYLPPGVALAWRPGVETPNLTALGTAMAADADIAKCAVARVWNWAMGKGDIVDLLVEVPAEVIQAQVDAFTQNGFKMKDMIYSAFTADDFVRF
jgi:hypothetical protein